MRTGAAAGLTHDRLDPTGGLPVPKLVLYTLVSLDGATEDPHRYFPETPDYIGPPVIDEDLARCGEAMLDRQRAVLLGRTTYDQWSRYWPTSDEQPFADFINGIRKYVVTSTPLTGDWSNAEAVSGDLADVVGEVKAATDGDVGVHASITLAKSLLAAGLVDELCLSVGRVLDPVGPRLFDTVPDRVEMRLLEAVPTSSGSLWLRYALGSLVEPGERQRAGVETR
jgi:dihydrofolate reductase